MLIVKTKDCSQDAEIVKFELPEQLIAKKISSILQFTAYDGFRISFDILSTLQHSIDQLIAYVEKKYREDIAQWITPRLLVLKRFINANKVEIPTCLKDVSTLLEILRPRSRSSRRPNNRRVSTLLEILHGLPRVGPPGLHGEGVSTLLEILPSHMHIRSRHTLSTFQPFLRFYRSCFWLLWVFKFFFGFL